MHRRDKTTDVMAKYLAKCFVDLCAADLAQERITHSGNRCIITSHTIKSDSCRVITNALMSRLPFQ